MRHGLLLLCGSSTGHKSESLSPILKQTYILLDSVNFNLTNFRFIAQLPSTIELYERRMAEQNNMRESSDIRQCGLSYCVVGYLTMHRLP
jgi:hypothetical protein